MSESTGNPDVIWSVGEGPTITVSVSLHRGTVQWIRDRTGKREFSAYVESSLRRQIERDNLRELIDAYTREHGDFTEEEMAAARASLYGTADPSQGSVA
jgi:hypothetical protein